MCPAGRVMNLKKLKKHLVHWFAGQSPNIVGIDIGTGQVKAAELSLHSGHPILKAAGLIDLPEHVVEDGYVFEREALADSIRRLLATSGISSRDVVVAVAGRAVFVREIIFPVMTKEELKAAVRWDMEKYVPYEPDSYYYDFAVIGPGKDEAELKVLLVAAPHELVNTLADALAAAGCKLLAIDIEPLAVFRTLHDVKNTMVIDIGTTISQISVFQDESPAVTRLIPIGGRKFTEVIMQTTGLEYPEAERLKQQTGMLKYRDLKGELSMAHQRLQLLASELGREVERTVEYYQAQNRETVLDRIYLTGGGSKLDNLPEYLAAQLGDIQVLRHNPLSVLTPAASLDREYLHGLAPQLAVAIGLALHGGMDVNY